jgi:site-specific DNA-cytosine methylase
MGKADERHLWPHMLRAIHEIRPTWVVGENVRGIISWDNGLVFEEVHAQLEAEGYEVQAFVLPAAGVDAPHRRDRVWFVAHAKSKRNDRSKGRDPQFENGTFFRQNKDGIRWGLKLRDVVENGLLPTPTAVQRDHPERVLELVKAGATSLNSRVNGEARPNSILDAVMFYGMLPTPRTNKATNLNLNSVKLANRNKGNLEEALAQIVVSFLPTPTASDNPAKNTGKMNQDSLQKRAFQVTGKPSQLNPRFVAEMMGFPADWTERPFYKEEKPENQHSITGEKNL